MSDALSYENLERFLKADGWDSVERTVDDSNTLSMFHSSDNKMIEILKTPHENLQAEYIRKALISLARFKHIAFEEIEKKVIYQDFTNLSVKINSKNEDSTINLESSVKLRNAVKKIINNAAATVVHAKITNSKLRQGAKNAVNLCVEDQTEKGSFSNFLIPKDAEITDS